MQVQIQHRHLTFNSGSTLGQKTYLLVKNPTDHQLTQVLQSYMQPAENIEASKRNQERVAENETRQNHWSQDAWLMIQMMECIIQRNMSHRNYSGGDREFSNNVVGIWFLMCPLNAGGPNGKTFKLA